MSTIRDLLNQPKQPVAPEVVAGVKALNAATETYRISGVSRSRMGTGNHIVRESDGKSLCGSPNRAVVRDIDGLCEHLSLATALNKTACRRCIHSARLLTSKRR